MALWSGPVFLLGVCSDYAQPITGQVIEVTCPVIGRAQPELTSSKRQKTGPVLVLGFLRKDARKGSHEEQRNLLWLLYRANKVVQNND